MPLPCSTYQLVNSGRQRIKMFYYKCVTGGVDDRIDANYSVSSDVCKI